MNLRELKRRAVRLHAEFIKRRDHYRCVICGSTHQVECAHLFAGRHNALLFDTRPDGACHTLCHACHMASHSRVPNVYAEWFKTKFGKDRYEELQEESHRIVRNSKEFLERIIRDLGGT